MTESPTDCFPISASMNDLCRKSCRTDRAAYWLPPWETFEKPAPANWPAGYRSTWMEVDLKALDHNLKVLRSRLPAGCAVAAVVKDNAYGHGLVPVARFLQSRVEWLAVAILEEALLLRQAGIQCPILVLNGVWQGQEEEFLHGDIIPALSDLSAMEALQKIAQTRGQSITFHLKLDSGMQRWGLAPGDLDSFLVKRKSWPHLRCRGLMTHLACAEETDPAFTQNQLASFRSVLNRMQKEGMCLDWIHAANSAGILYHPGSHFNLVRPGISLYGYDPRSEEDGIRNDLQPVLAWKSRIALVRHVDAGSFIGYGATFRFPRATRVAVVPVGYGDGFSRLFSNRGQISIAGQLVPIVGRVSMDAITVDIGSIPEATVDTEVLLLGKENGSALSADRLAGQIGSISYEVLTSLSSRIGRLYLL